MCHTRNYWEFDKNVFSAEIFSVTQITALPVGLWFRDGISFSHLIPTWPLPISDISRPQGERRGFSKSKEDGELNNSPFPCFRKQGHPRSVLTLTRDLFQSFKNHHWQKSFANTQPEFSNTSQLLCIIQLSALQPHRISFLLYPQNTCRYWYSSFHSSYDALENVLSTPIIHFKSRCGLVSFCENFNRIGSQRQRQIIGLCIGKSLGELDISAGFLSYYYFYLPGSTQMPKGLQSIAWGSAQPIQK